MRYTRADIEAFSDAAVLHECRRAVGEMSPEDRRRWLEAEEQRKLAVGRLGFGAARGRGLKL